MTNAKPTLVQESIVKHLGEGWQQQTPEAIVKAVPDSKDADISALIGAGYLENKTVHRQQGFLAVATECCRLTIKGERLADSLKGQNSAEIEQGVVNRVLLAVGQNPDKTLLKGSITATEVGPARLAHLLENMEKDGLLSPQRPTQRFSSHEAYQLTVAGERAVDVLAGRDSAECERRATAVIIQRLENCPEGVLAASMAGTGGLGPARLAATFARLVAQGRVEETRIQHGHFSHPAYRPKKPADAPRAAYSG